MSTVYARLIAVLASLLMLTACGADAPTPPKVKITAGDAKAIVAPTLYCIGGKAKIGDDKTHPSALQVKPDTKVQIAVPQEVADIGWTIQIWTVNDSPEGTVPLAQIGNVPVGKKRTFDGFTTSDAVPDRYFVIVALPEDKKCDAKGSAGIWTVLVSRL